MLIEIPLNLPTPYLSKKLESTTLKHCLDNSAFVAYEMYLVTNGVKRRYDFLDLNDEHLSLSAHVSVNYAFIGEAKDQAWNVKHFSMLLKKRPKYTVFCELSVKGQYNNHIHKFRFETTRETTVYRLIQETKDEIKKILESNGKD
jgi:hypothetical protein